jgi:hypothetical protein
MPVTCGWEWPLGKQADMWIQMLIGISGGRADDRPWPPVGEEIEVPDHEGEDLVRARHALFVRPSFVPPPPAAPPPPAPPHPRPAEPASVVVSEPAQTAAGPKAPQVRAPEPATRNEREHPREHSPGHAPQAPKEVIAPPAPPAAPVPPAATAAAVAPEPAVAAEEPPAPPAPADPKAAWIAYAVSQGAQPDRAAMMTKADLMSRYGGRL